MSCEAKGLWPRTLTERPSWCWLVNSLNSLTSWIAKPMRRSDAAPSGYPVRNRTCSQECSRYSQRLFTEPLHKLRWSSESSSQEQSAEIILHSRSHPYTHRLNDCGRAQYIGPISPVRSSDMPVQYGCVLTTWWNRRAGTLCGGRRLPGCLDPTTAS